jgi:hypothetical protein
LKVPGKGFVKARFELGVRASQRSQKRIKIEKVEEAVMA